MAKPPPRLFVEDDLAEGATLALARDQAHYLTTVLRLQAGAPVLLFNGRDGELAGEIADMGRKGARVAVRAQTREQAAGPDLTLLFAPLKKSPTDLVVRMGTELGVRAFRPVLTERPQADRVNTERLSSIAREAAEQCERLDVPRIHEPVRLGEALLGEAPLMFCDESGDPGVRWGGGAGRGAPAARALADAPTGPWSVLIGPEGGFSPSERGAIRARPAAYAVSLGPRILKAETAAAAALTLWGAVRGDLR